MKTVSPSPTPTYYSRDGQNIYDICLQVYQDLNMVYKLIQDNNWQDIDLYPVAGTPFVYTSSLSADTLFSSYISKNAVHINTGNYKAPAGGYLLQEDGFKFELEGGTGDIELES